MSFDLLTMTRYTLADVGMALSWDDLYDFVRNIPTGSAIFRALEPESASWLDGRAICGLLADIFDAVSVLRCEFLAAHGVTVEHSPHSRPGDAKREAEKMEAARRRLSELDDLIGGANG